MPCERSQDILFIEVGMIRLRGVTKVYRGAVDYTAVSGVDLDINAGEFTAIVGESGSGKTTLLNLIGTLDTPSAGTIEINGKAINEMNDAQKAEFRNQTLGFIFQAFYLEPFYTVAQCVEVPLLIAGIGKKERKQRVEVILNEFHIIDKANVFCNQLSGGEKQRACIARAMVNDPQIVLADEPCGNLDTKNRAIIMDKLYGFKEQKKTVVLVTHHLQDTDKADHIVTLSDGRIVDEQKGSGNACI